MPHKWLQICLLYTSLSEDSIEDKIEKLNRSVYNIQYKRKKLLENYLEGVVAKDIYEETDVGYEKKLSEAKAQLSICLLYTSRCV